MVHSPPPSVSAGQLAEAVVGELIGLPGIDLTLVGPLAELSATATDRLTLESLSGDVAVLDWQTAAEIVTSLSNVGLEGNRTPHADDPHAAAPSLPGRRIYAFDLTKFRDAQTLCRAITLIKSGRQIRTFSLLPGPIRETKTASIPARGRQNSDADHAPAISVVGTTTDPAASPQPAQAARTLDLDDLLDQLDDLDP